MAIFIKEVLIKNYKCFDDERIALSVPNGSQGSGLNILIGDNGNGKTTTLEAINYLTLNSFSAENKLSVSDFSDFRKEIEIEGQTNEFYCSSSIDYYRGWKFKSSGICFRAKNRISKERGKLLSSPFQINNNFLTGTNYIKENGEEGKEIDGRDKIFSNARISDENELGIFFFDKNRTRQIGIGSYKTTFQKICDDLNWNFIKNLNSKNVETIIQNIAGEYFANVEEITKKSVGRKTAKDLSSFFENDEFEKIRIELLNLLHPFSNSFFAIRNKNSLSQINVRDLGSGIEIILTLLILKNIAGAANGSIIYLIDEPELHLHPKAQIKLLDLLLEESKDKQIIISTHSPYLFRGAISKNATLLLFSKDRGKKVTITNARDKNWGLFPWSPSWGEINYFAYNMPTIEFHGELYGFLHERYIGTAIDQNEADNKGKQTYFEKNYLQTKLTERKKWTPEFGGAPKNEESVTLSTFIRNKIHHPENKTMKDSTYENDELRQSIEELINLVKNP